MTKAKMEELLNKQSLEISHLTKQLEAAGLQIQMLDWHKKANDRFLDILGATAKAERLGIDRTTRRHEDAPR